jgi:hypothetical protein
MEDPSFADVATPTRLLSLEEELLRRPLPEERVAGCAVMYWFRRDQEVVLVAGAVLCRLFLLFFDGLLAQQRTRGFWDVSRLLQHGRRQSNAQLFCRGFRSVQFCFVRWDIVDVLLFALML